MPVIITDPKQAQFLLSANELCVDIETDTQDPHTGWGGKFGLSFCAPITWVAFHVENQPTVVFDMGAEDKDEKITLIREVLKRPNIRIIGHNATFDLRSLGGQYGFKVALGSQVWDTLTMTILLLMSNELKADLALKNLIRSYHLLDDKTKSLPEIEQETTDSVDDDESDELTDIEFIDKMKSLRNALHTASREDVLLYVAADSITTFRLYKLQQAIIDTSEDFQAEPISVFDEEGNWSIQITYPTDRPSRFISTKKWNKLQELVEWEQRISRWSANASIQGVHLNIPYVKQHMERITVEYMQALNTVYNAASNWHPEIINDIAYLVWYDAILTSLRSGKRPPKRERWQYWQVNDVVLKDAGIFSWDDNERNEPSDTILNYFKEWTDYLADYPNVDEPKTENGTIWIPVIDPIRYIANKLWPDDFDGMNRAKIAWDWFTQYFSLTKQIELKQLVNKKAFQPFYVFCVCNAPFPLNEDIYTFTHLLTSSLKKRIETGKEEDTDFIRTAHETAAWSIGEDSQKFYLSKIGVLKEGTEDQYIHDLLVPFMIVSSHESKLNRIEEFLRHAERDGKIHSIIARKTRTSRMTSVSMNMQNMDMDFYRGYMTADDDDHVLTGIDISNAENYFAALTFGDSRLALACISHDFHEQMARGYWGNEHIDHLLANDREGFEKLRKKGKMVTFGGAYGAGAKKIARMVGCTLEQAQQLLANRDQYFFESAIGKDKVIKKVEKLYQDGFRPPFTTLWTGRRIPVPILTFTRRIFKNGKLNLVTAPEVVAYKATNYLQQGGVGELVSRAQVIASEEFEKQGLDATIPLQVHDEIIAHVHKDIAFQAAHIICQAIAEVVPEEYRNRTSPAVRFLSALGPENAKKWGYNPLREYPLPLNKFVNQWGTFDMPEDASKAPMWVVAPGENVEDEYVPEPEKKAQVSTNDLTEWKSFGRIVRAMMTDCELMSDRLLTPMKVTVNGEERGPFLFEERMEIERELHHRGLEISQTYWDNLAIIDRMCHNAQLLADWNKERNK